MIKHEFYADPTVFDHWQTRAESWLCSNLGKYCPYLWSVSFCIAAAACGLVGIGVFRNLLLQTLGGSGVIGANQFLAQSLTVVIALIACQGLVEQGAKAWPAAKRPAWLARLATVHSSAPSAHCLPTPCRPVAAQAPATAAGRQAIQDFFTEVRAAGVNVAIARSLFVAGIRSAEQLRRVPDCDLLKIRGIGPATLQRLRGRFGSGPAGASR